MKYIALSGGAKAPKLFALDKRIGAVQALEVCLKETGKPLVAVRGNTAIRKFIEGEASVINWGDYRLDIVEVA